MTDNNSIYVRLCVARASRRITQEGFARAIALWNRNLWREVRL